MRGFLLIAAIVVLVAGCGAQVDLSKQTYPRTTVPAGQQPTDDTGSTETATPRTNDPAFTPEKLRSIDPCPLLDEDVLDDLGTPADTLRNEFAECANYMEDKDGKELNITLTIGEKVSNAPDADENIGGLPALENMLDTGEACFVTVVTSTSPNFGISIQANGNSDDLCAPARTIMTSVVDRIRSDPPVYDPAKGSLVDVDPCTFFEEDELTEQLGGAPERSPYNLHWCTWASPAVSLGVWARIGYDPEAGDGTKVGLGGGVTGYQRKTEGVPSCQIDWKHRPFAGEDVEIISLFYELRDPESAEDPCQGAQTVAKTLVPILPKP